MVVKGIIKKGEYFDSVTLMRVARAARELPGVSDCAVVMGTSENRAILENSGLLLDAFKAAGDADLLIALKAESGEALDEGLGKVDLFLKGSRKSPSGGKTRTPASLAAALGELPGANLVLVSVAGRYAGGVAAEALESGLNVMLFSDNVPLETEIALKKTAAEKGLLVMGPDCGTAIINGVPLAFANAVRRGKVGIVAAAGTGLQEVSCILSNEGEGVSQAIGTGGRDISAEVGGATFLQGLRLLARDPATEVLLLVSKPPSEAVLQAILQEAGKAGKPSAAVFLGGDPEAFKDGPVSCYGTLEEAALAAFRMARGEAPSKASEALAHRAGQERELAAVEVKPKAAGQRFVRGLFTGGTFCAEAQVVLRPAAGEMSSNAPLPGVARLDSGLESKGHTVVDLGADEFTVGRPHPMIDYSLRNDRILKEARDPETAVLLLDVVIGFGSNPKPAEELAPVIREAREKAREQGRHLSVVCSVTGTDADPQGRGDVARALGAAGALVMPSNASACRLAGEIVRSLK